MQPWNWKYIINKCGRNNKLQFHFDISAVSALGVYYSFFFFFMTIRLFELRVFVAFLLKENNKIGSWGCQSLHVKAFHKVHIVFGGALYVWGGEQIVPCTKMFLYLGNVATVRPNPTLNLVLETILVFLGHQSFQGGSKGRRGGGGLGESWEGNSSCTCNPCESALKQIGSCKAKFGPTHHVV
jgi:hypothetical protein